MSDEVIHLLNLPLQHQIRLRIFGKWRVIKTNGTYDLEVDDVDEVWVDGTLWFNDSDGRVVIK